MVAIILSSLLGYGTECLNIHLMRRLAVPKVPIFSV